MNKTIIIGMIAGLASVGWLFFQYSSGWTHSFEHSWTQIINYVIIFLGVLIPVLVAKSINNGFIPMKTIIKHGMLSTVVMVIILGIGYYIHYRFVDTSYPEFISTEWEKVLSKETDPVKIAEGKKQISQFQETYSPGMPVFGAVTISLISGTVLSLLLGLILRKER